MAGVVFVLKFLGSSSWSSQMRTWVSQRCRIEVGVDDASLTFGVAAPVGLALRFTGGGDLLLSAHKRTFPAGLESFVRESKGQPEGTALLDHYCSRRALPDGGEGRKLLRGLENCVRPGVNDKIRATGRLERRPITAGLGFAYGSGGPARRAEFYQSGCHMWSQRAVIRPSGLWRGVAGCWPTSRSLWWKDLPPSADDSAPWPR